MPKRIMNSRDTKLRLYYSVARASNEAGVPSGVMMALFDLVLIKYLNAPADVDHITIAGVQFNTEDLVLTTAANFTGQYDLMVSRYAFNELKELAAQIHAPVKHLLPNDSFTSDTRQRFIKGLEHHLEYPKDKGVRLVTFVQGRRQSLAVTIDDDEHREYILREEGNLRDNAIDFSAKSSRGKVLALIEQKLLKRGTTDEHLRVKDIDVPVDACEYGYSMRNVTRLFVNNKARDQVDAIADAQQSEVKAAEVAKVHDQPKEWLGVQDFSALSGIPLKGLNAMLTNMKKVAAEMLRHPESRERYMKKVGALETVYYTPGGAAVGVDLPFHMLKSQGQSFLFHRDLAEPLAAYLEKNAGVKISRTDNKHARG